MALAPNALTTPLRVEAELGDTADPADVRLEYVIDEVSTAFCREAGRSFHHVESSVFDVEGFGSSALLLPRAPITSVASIQSLDVTGTVNGTTDPATVRIRAAAGILWRASGWLSTAPTFRTLEAQTAFGEEGPLWRVTCNSGFRTRAQLEAGTVFADAATIEALPADIEKAVLISIAALWHRAGKDLTVSSSSKGGDAISFRLPNAIVGLSADLLLPETIAIARRYQRPV